MKDERRHRSKSAKLGLLALDCACGGVSVIDDKFERPATDGVLRTRTRRRICSVCSNKWKTVEIEASELQSLRLHAHLFLMSLRATPETQRALQP